MANSPAVQVASVLIAASVGSSVSTDSWPITVGRLMSDPDAQIALYDSPGQTPNPKWLLDFPIVQVMVRGGKDDYPGGWSKAQDIKDVLLGRDVEILIDGDRWDGITMLGDVSFLKYDENSRPLFTANYRIIREPAASALTQREPL